MSFPEESASLAIRKISTATAHGFRQHDKRRQIGPASLEITNDGSRMRRIHTAGKLSPYLNGSDVRLCPSLDAFGPQFKLKAVNVVCSYGYNSRLSSAGAPVSVDQIRRVSETAIFADAAQVNDFQAPATRSSPMVEEWYYLDSATNFSSASYYAHGHFRHAQRANVTFADGHVALEAMVPGSLDKKLPAQQVGQLRPEILTLP